MKTVLNGHTSPETAYIVEDYPYGFTLRCKMRCWVETRKGFGMRYVTQTTNPKRPVETWNKPKAGTYSGLVVMYRDESNGHIECDGLHSSTGPDNFVRFHDEYYDQLDEESKKRYDTIEKISRHYNPNSWAEHDAKVATPV
jgi:hypothetical protein